MLKCNILCALLLSMHLSESTGVSMTLCFLAMWPIFTCFRVVTRCDSLCAINFLQLEDFLQNPLQKETFGPADHLIISLLRMNQNCRWSRCIVGNAELCTSTVFQTSFDVMTSVTYMLVFEQTALWNMLHGVASPATGMCRHHRYTTIKFFVCLLTLSIVLSQIFVLFCRLQRSWTANKARQWEEEQQAAQGRAGTAQEGVFSWKGQKFRHSGAAQRAAGCWKGALP